jgi:fatty acid desaturase
MSKFAELPAEILPIQGSDPLQHEEIHRALWTNYFSGVKVIVGPLNDLAESLSKEYLKEPERDKFLFVNGIKWLVFYLPFWAYLLLVMDYEAHPVQFAACAVAFILTWVDQLGTYILSLHCIVHRPSMKTHQNQHTLKNVWSFVFGPMMGVVPETYQAHHIGMHHVRNNGEQDTSSTMAYRRDSAWDLFRYFVKFHTGHISVVRALYDLNNVKAMRRFLICECAFHVIGWVLAYYRGLPPVLLCWFLPMFAVRTGMLVGNFGQHAFLNDADPYNDYNLSAVIMDSFYNTKAFNDGYHIQHHMYPSAHHLDLPRLFAKDLPMMAVHDSVVFTSRQGSKLVDWVSLTILLVTKQYDVLADHFVDCRALVNGSEPRSKEEIVELLKSRTCKVYKTE